MSILIITPLLLGQTLHPDVIKGVATNGNHSWLISTQPNQLSIYCTEAEINLHRHRLQQEALKLDWDYAVLLDSDVVMPLGAIVDMRDALTDDMVAVAIDSKGQDWGHVITACALMRRKDFERLRYLDGDICECACRKIARLGNIKYVGPVAYEIAKHGGCDENSL